MKNHTAAGALALLVTAALLIGCVGCGKDPAEPSADAPESTVPIARATDTVPSATTASTTLQPENSTTGSTQPEKTQMDSTRTKSKPAATTTKAASQTTKAPAKPARKTVQVAISEGLTVDEIAHLLEKKGVCRAGEFIQIAQKYSPQSFSIPADSRRAYKMEGYLYPDTYTMYADEDPKKVLTQLLSAYRAKVGKFSDRQLIVASIVEKESGSAKQAALMASVIYNRLQSSMKLDMDCTQEYIDCHLTDSPYLTDTEKYVDLYDTYVCSGLPAGPICNPGRRAIEAARHPANTQYHYYFLGQDDQIHYSKTYTEHRAAIWKYGTKDTIKFDNHGIKMVAHRGLSGLEKENTCAAFAAAGSRHYYGIEADVRLTADGEFVILHDHNLSRVTNGAVNMTIREHTWEELQDVILPDRNGAVNRADLRLPRMEDYLHICKTYRKECILEIKGLFKPEDVQRLVERIRAEKYLDHVTFIAADWKICMAVREMLPDSQIQLVAKKVDESMIEQMKKYRLDLNVDYGALTKEKVAMLHKNGILVNCWTCNTTEAAARLIDMGVDFITTDILEGRR